MSIVEKTGRNARRATYCAFAALLATSGLAIADGYFTLKTTVTISGNPLASFDISWVSPELNAYFLSDRSNKAVDVIDTVTKTQRKLAAGAFAGNVPSCAFPNACNGPNGVLTFYNEASKKHEVWAGDGPTAACTARQTLETATTACSTVKVIDFETGAVLHNIPTGGQYRADEPCHDPVNHLIQIANDSDLPFPYINYIPTEGPDAYKVVKQIQFDGLPGHGPAATNGIEQCKWNPRNGLIYLNIPEVDGNGSDIVPGHTVRIDPKTMKIVDQFVIPIDKCAGPQGMAIGPDPQILLGCNAKGPPLSPLPVTSATTGTGPQNTVVIDERNGSVIKTIENQGGNDEVWFNPGNGLYFLAEGSNAAQGQLGIVSSFSLDVKQDIVVARPPGTGHAHSVAADPKNGEVYFPIPNNLDATNNTAPNPCPSPATGCVAIYSAQ
jgi:hypothetical protein